MVRDQLRVEGGFTNADVKFHAGLRSKLDGCLPGLRTVGLGSYTALIGIEFDAVVGTPLLGHDIVASSRTIVVAPSIALQGIGEALVDA